MIASRHKKPKLLWYGVGEASIKPQGDAAGTGQRVSTPMKGSAWRAAKVESGQDVALLQALVSILNDGKKKSVLDEFNQKQKSGQRRQFQKAISMKWGELWYWISQAWLIVDYLLKLCSSSSQGIFWAGNSWDALKFLNLKNGADRGKVIWIWCLAYIHPVATAYWSSRDSIHIYAHHHVASGWIYNFALMHCNLQALDAAKCNCLQISIGKFGIL